MDGKQEKMNLISEILLFFERIKLKKQVRKLIFKLEKPKNILKENIQIKNESRQLENFMMLEFDRKSYDKEKSNRKKFFV